MPINIGDFGPVIGVTCPDGTESPLEFVPVSPIIDNNNINIGWFYARASRCQDQQYLVKRSMDPQLTVPEEIVRIPFDWKINLAANLAGGVLTGNQILDLINTTIEEAEIRFNTNPIFVSLATIRDDNLFVGKPYNIVYLNDPTSDNVIGFSMTQSESLKLARAIITRESIKLVLDWKAPFDPISAEMLRYYNALKYPDSSSQIAEIQALILAELERELNNKNKVDLFVSTYLRDSENRNKIINLLTKNYGTLLIGPDNQEESDNFVLNVYMSKQSNRVKIIDSLVSDFGLTLEGTGQINKRTVSMIPNIPVFDSSANEITNLSLKYKELYKRALEDVFVNLVNINLVRTVIKGYAYENLNNFVLGNLMSGDVIFQRSWTVDFRRNNALQYYSNIFIENLESIPFLSNSLYFVITTLEW